MSRLEKAAESLGRSVARLEAAIGGRRRGNGAGGPSAGVGSEENARLRQVTDTVSARLDDAIARLKRVLES